MDKITHKVRCEQWTAIVNECLAKVGFCLQSEQVTYDLHSAYPH